jgi:hypothetical protein
VAGQIVQIELRAKDGSSQVFRKVGSEAQAMGRQVDKGVTAWLQAILCMESFRGEHLLEATNANKAAQ